MGCRRSGKSRNDRCEKTDFLIKYLPVASQKIDGECSLMILNSADLDDFRIMPMFLN
jgi:hypothetical protein